MPDPTVIDFEQREGIYELVRTHLGSIEDFWVALERTRDFATAERLGHEFAEDFRLLEDIGWAPCESCESFALTMPVHDLMELLKRLHSEAEQVLVQSVAERRASEGEARVAGRFQLGYDACEEVLADLDPR